MLGIFTTVFAAHLSQGLGLSTAGSIDVQLKSVYSLGGYAPLTQEGYQSVAALHKDEEMKSFIRRLLQNGARTVTDESGLSDFARHYSGSAGSRDLEAMKKELDSPRTAWWVREGLGKTAPLSDAGLAQVAELDDHVQVRAFLRRVVQSLEREVEDENLFESLAWELPCTIGNDCFRKVKSILSQPGYTTDDLPVSAEDVPLNEDGYRRLAALKRNKGMKVFVKRVLESEGRSIKNRTGLSGFVPYYSGKVGVKDLATMKTELLKPANAWWVDSGLGRTSPLTEAGFQSVLGLKDRVQMKAFIRRLANPGGQVRLTEAQLGDLVLDFSGEIGAPKFNALKRELERVARR